MEISCPTLLLDTNKALTNLVRMLSKVGGKDLEFRPHFKTIQSKRIGAFFRAKGVDRIAVSSVKMAEYFAAADWGDITVAFPCNILEIESINALARSIKLNLLVESRTIVDLLAQNLEASVGVFIKIDTGYGRTGIISEEVHKIDTVLAGIEQSEQMVFKGFLSHFGHTYKVNGKEAIQQIFEEGNAQLRVLKERYTPAYPNLEISIGDTPTCSVLDDFGVATEIRPGNFIFYDLMQWQIGSCNLEDIAVALACPVVAKHEDRKELIIYGGGIHLSKDRINHLETNETYYGLAFPLSDDGWDLNQEPSIVRSLSQEHGIVKATNAFYESVEIGDVIATLPIHSCMTANLMKSYLSLEGEYIEMMQ